MYLMLLPKDVRRISRRTVDGYDIRDYEKNELRDILLEEYAWDLTLQGRGVSFTIEENPVPLSIDRTLDKAYSLRRGFQLKTYVTDAELEKVVECAVNKVSDQQVLGGPDELIRFDKASDQFIFCNEYTISTLDMRALKKDVRAAVKNKDYDAVIELKYDDEVTYLADRNCELIGSFETDTTKNSDRNTNVNLACETINGTILQPGEQFSYNDRLGKRTREKGYRVAGVYLNGKHAMGIGGGICQVSSTLFNAAFAANLQIDERKGHTFKPTYVRPGLDATVSYPTQDFKFTNSSEYPIGIAAHFADCHVTVEIYGVPTLDYGVTRHMESQGSGATYKTYEVLEKNGEEISREQVYLTKYKLSEE